MTDESGQEIRATSRQEVKKRADLITIDIEPHNSSILHDLRKQVDKANDDKLTAEVRKYSEGEEGRKAIIALDNLTPSGYVEMKPSEELPEGTTSRGDLNEYAHLARVGVLPEARGRGIGKRLMQTAEEWAKEQDKKGLWLDYLANNKPAEALYRSLGYAVVELFTDKDNRKRVLVKKDLTRENDITEAVMLIEDDRKDKDTSQQTSLAERLKKDNVAGALSKAKGFLGRCSQT